MDTENLRACIQNDADVVRLGEVIRELQCQLRNACSPEAWTLYLRVEEASNARLVAVEDAALALISAEVDAQAEED